MHASMPADASRACWYRQPVLWLGALLFAASFMLHAWGSWKQELSQRLLEGEPPETLGAHLASAQFWFESFQNWQSEFLAVLAIVVLSIWLRQHDSPQSKPVDAPHSQTGT